MQKNHCQSKGSRFFLLISLLLGICVTFGSQQVRAEPHLRVCKNGVIYYYFSQRGSQSGQLALRPGNPGTIRPPFNSRLTASELDPLIQEASRRYSLPPSLVKAVIRVESNFNPAATSPKGAQGLMQLMPQTAGDLQVSNAYDVRENVWAGTSYLGSLLQKFNYHLPLALAAYNAGPQRVERSQGVPAIKETQAFVRDVCVNFLQYSKEKIPPP